MNKYVHLQLARKDIPTKIDVVQYATKPDIVFVLDDYTPSSGATSTFHIEKQDGTELDEACTVSGNEVTYSPSEDAFNMDGVSLCQLQIVEQGGTGISFPIVTIVAKNIINYSEIESQNEFLALDEALQTVSSYDSRITSNTNRLDNLGDEYVTFEEATVDTTISDNLTLSTIFGRIKHLFTRTKTIEDTIAEGMSGTDYTKLYDGTLIQWGSAGTYASAKRRDLTVTLPQAFNDTAYSISVTERYFAEPEKYEVVNTCNINSASQFTIHQVNVTDNYLRGVQWIAVGRWK